MAQNMLEDTIIRTDYSEIMQKSYIDYAMSVIIDRALPDVRDGLKPVQRRTLYDMHELGIRYDRPYRKCARIVGDTMGKYHPHGDSSIYEALVVMAQDFKKGEVLVDGHGNFGSIEGDGAAAMRYTEARLSRISQEVYLADLDKNVVDFGPNFDETEQEPQVLPVRIPNILLNGAEGIAVGMATSIPPHNLGEIVSCMKAYIRNKDITDKQLLHYLKGPDFPTGGIIVNQEELPKIYETGTGRLRIRGRVNVEHAKGGKDLIVITEIPYTMIGAGIGKFLNDVALLAETKKTQDIADISNQSSKEGIRIVIELRKGADPEKLINLLYKKTKLEDIFPVNMLAVADGRPETLSLRRIIEETVDFRFEIANRKYENLLGKELEKKEIQEGLIEACDVIDLIIEILRGSRNQKMAKDCLVLGITDGIKFKSEKSRKTASLLHFTERQADAILNMRLVKLIGLEVEALLAEHRETLANIERYESLLNDYDVMAEDIINDLDAIKTRFARKRRTELDSREEVVIAEEAPEERPLVFVMDRFGYAKTMEPSLYEKNKETVDADAKYVFSCMSAGKICLFTDKGRVHSLRVSDLPLCKTKDKGTPVDNVSNYSNTEEEIIYVCDSASLAASEVTFVTAQGMIKRQEGSELVSSVRTVLATKLLEDDRVIFAGLSAEMNQVVIITKDGRCIRFAKEEVPVQKKNAAGVRAIKLDAKEKADRAYLFESGTSLSVEWNGKTISLHRLKTAKRGGQGTKIR